MRLMRIDELQKEEEAEKALEVCFSFQDIEKYSICCDLLLLQATLFQTPSCVSYKWDWMQERRKSAQAADEAKTAKRRAQRQKKKVLRHGVYIGC